MKRFYLFSLLLIPFLSGCINQNQDVVPGPSQDNIIKVDYLNDGGANIPTTWDEKDTAETVRKGSFKVEEKTFEIEFVGQWYNSTNKQEFQTKKDPVSYVRAASNLVVKKVVVETFSADMKVYLTNDHTGNEVNGKEVNASHGDGSATEYEINSATWSILAFETYKGSNINIYSFTFYF